MPDFVANAGGVIHIHALREEHDEDRLRADVLRIGDRVRDLLAEGGVPLAAAEARARQLIARKPIAA